MGMTKIKMAIVLLALAIAGGGIALLARSTPTEQPAAPEEQRKTTAKPEAKPKLEQRVYQVMDLVTSPAQRKQVGQQRKAAQTAEDKLVFFLLKTVAPNTWSDHGGPGTIDYHPLTMSLVVNQTPEVHERIARLLSLLERFDDLDNRMELTSLLISTKEGQAFLPRYVADKKIKLGK